MKFHPQMFYGSYCLPQGPEKLTPAQSAEMAQKAFNEWLEKQPALEVAQLCNGVEYVTPNIRKPTHKARLVAIEPIENPKCEHVAVSVGRVVAGKWDEVERFWKCENCGIKLRAKWEEVSE